MAIKIGQELEPDHSVSPFWPCTNFSFVSMKDHPVG